MKKISLLLSAICISAIVFTGCKKTPPMPPAEEGEKVWFEPENKQRSLMLNFTATWCTYCGLWGHPAFKSAENTLGDDAIAFAVQASGSDLIAVQYKNNNDTPYFSRHLPEFTSSLKGITVGGYPTLCVNGKSGYSANSQNAMVADAQAFNSKEPVANINFGITKNANGFVARTTTKFFKETSGEYYVTMFITENNIINKQNVGGTYQNNYVHSDIIRGFPITNSKENSGVLVGLNKTFGTPVISGSISANKFVNMELTYVADNKGTLLPGTVRVFNWNQSNTANLFVTAIVWKKDNDKYVFVNGVRKAL